MTVPMRNSIFNANDEPTVEELLADPIASLLMARDGVQPREVLAIIDRARTAQKERAALGRPYIAVTDGTG